MQRRSFHRRSPVPDRRPKKTPASGLSDNAPPASALILLNTCAGASALGVGEPRVRGERYPITPHGLKTHWRRRRARAGVSGFRWHHNRHDFATELLRATGNLKLHSPS